ncbi:dioxygenase family protein [Streptomyces sp. H27-D2]|uniref:dioxygenase family protein n=1 Tax=Streptomyces sp. H27-D2 TaxID=3046304 RepID=UPI002DBDE572|nr:dioxygenase [Streptomyces sp. H27-D2]MEC4019438.1 dioxygenase [Streptomyces sp. H27-D2]
MDETTSPGTAPSGSHLTLTPECICRGTPPTPEQNEGPYYKPYTPHKADFRQDVTDGTPLVLSGQVVNGAGEPVGGALLDFWQVGDEGVYDDAGFRLRGHQFADPKGYWRLETVLPAMYPGRTRHLHVKVQPPGGEVLTTMLYFPEERRNHLDKHFRPECLMTVQQADGGWKAQFTFVV